LTEFSTFDIFPGTKTIDGDLSDWEDETFYLMTDKYVRMNNTIAKDVTIGTKFSYDEDNLYFAAKVHDKAHVHTGTNTYWGGDSLQLRYMGTTDRPSGTEFAIILLDDEERTVGVGSNIQSMATRDGEYTYYECAIPWSVNFKEGVPQIFPFNAILNNNDGDGRAYWMQFTGGIGERKAPELYKSAVVYSPLGDIYHSIHCPEEYTGEGTAVEIYLKNPSIRWNSPGCWSCSLPRRSPTRARSSGGSWRTRRSGVSSSTRSAGQASTSPTRSSKRSARRS